MQASRIDDEMLMAYVDGELGAEDAEAVRRATAADPALARRAAEFRETRRLAREVFLQAPEEPVPDRLVAAAQPRRRGRVVAFPQRIRLLPVALAASLALVAGLGGYLAGRTGPDAPQVAGAPLLEATDLETALDGTPSGEAMGKVRMLGTYPTADALCRTFALDADGARGRYRGVACRRGGDWRIELAVSDAVPEGAYATASDRASQSVDAFLDAVGAKPRLDPTAERQALQSAL